MHIALSNIMLVKETIKTLVSLIFFFLKEEMIELTTTGSQKIKKELLL